MDIDAVICATVTPDMFFPSTANLIAYKAGMKKHSDLTSPQLVVDSCSL